MNTLLRLSLLAALFGSSQAVLAHNPSCHCQALDAENIQCKAGFSDGSDAPGIIADVISHDENMLVEGHFDPNSRFTFKRPETEFYVLCDAGPGHVVEVDFSDIPSKS